MAAFRRSRKRQEEELFFKAKIQRIHSLYDQGYTSRDILGENSLLEKHFGNSAGQNSSKNGAFSSQVAGQPSAGAGQTSGKRWASIKDLPKPVTRAMSLAYIQNQQSEKELPGTKSLWKICSSKPVSKNIPLHLQARSEVSAFDGLFNGSGTGTSFRERFIQRSQSQSHEGGSRGGSPSGDSSSQLSQMHNPEFENTSSVSRRSEENSERSYSEGIVFKTNLNYQQRNTRTENNAGTSGSKYFSSMNRFKTPIRDNNILVLDSNSINHLDVRNMNTPFKSPWINRTQSSRGPNAHFDDGASVSMFSNFEGIVGQRIPVKDMLEILSRRGEDDDILQSQVLASQDFESMNYLNVPEDNFDEAD